MMRGVKSLFDENLPPVDICGCGDTGYLTSRTLPIDLLHGPGKVYNVPVYTCGDSMCDEYTIPSVVASRLDALAEEMEQTKQLMIEFSWKSSDHSNPMDSTLALIQAFTWKFLHRAYEDAQVILVIPGDTILLQSQIDTTEYYSLKYLAEEENGVWFSFSKFFLEDTQLTYEKYLEITPLYPKELATLKIDEVEDALIEEFGEIVD
jgi:hypothetical protein